MDRTAWNEGRARAYLDRVATDIILDDSFPDVTACARRLMA